MFRRFLDATDYWFGYSDNSSAGSYDPARECFVILATTKRMPRMWQKPATERFPPAGELDRTRERGQARLPPHRRGGRHQRAAGSSARARSQACGGILCGAATSRLHRRGSFRARELGKQVHECINVDNPNAPPRESQKLVAAATLLRAMPAPSTPEARNLHREAQALIEQAVVQ
jgi:hypothetical protein